MDAEMRTVIDNGLRKVEADIAVLKIHCQAAGALQVFAKLTEAQHYVRDAIVEMMPDPPLS